MEAARPQNASSYRYGSSKASERFLTQVWKQQASERLLTQVWKQQGLRTLPHAGMETARPQNASSHRYGSSKASDRVLTQVWKQQVLRTLPHAGMEAARPHAGRRDMKEKGQKVRLKNNIKTSCIDLHI